MKREHEVVAVVEGLTVRRLRIWVREGWVRPARRDGDALFSDADLARLRLICHLRHELNVNQEAMPVVLSLMDQLYGVRHELRCFVQAVERQETPVREDILHHVRGAKEPGD